MSSDDQIERLLMQLVRETSVGNVRWSLTEPHYFLNNATDDLVVANFGASYGDLSVGVYEARYKYWRDEDEFYWCSEIRFSVAKYDSLIVDYRKSSAALQQLYEMARTQVMDFDSLLKGSFF